ncbi:MAG TPA: hypothetical protein VLJ44_01755 [Gaiellaceae bacterium]|nr:hypothetical protein [Gaiellaceae bacterium]
MVGDPVDAVIGAAVDGIGAEHERRQFRRGFHGLVESAARRPNVSTTPDSQPVDEESVAREKAKQILDGLSPAERDAVGTVLDEETAALIYGEVEAEQAASGSAWPWQASEPMPWEGQYTPPEPAAIQPDWHQSFIPDEEPEDLDDWLSEFGEDEE